MNFTGHCQTRVRPLSASLGNTQHLEEITTRYIMDSSSSAGRCTELAGSKRVQCLPFPGGFEELIINLLADRSAFLRTQRECVADAGGDACIDLPAEVTSDWLYGLISTTAALIATDDSKLVECLKVSVSMMLVTSTCLEADQSAHGCSSAALTAVLILVPHLYMVAA